MTMPTSNVLLVEGDEDKRVIPELMEANGIQWERSPKRYAVDIDALGGVDEIVKPHVIATRLKESGLQALGIMLDADHDARGRWQRLGTRCRDLVADWPNAIPEQGFIGTAERDIRLGVWLMPDNRSQGMLETFLTWLRPDENQALLDHAKTACEMARTSHGAPYRDAHLDKAEIYTWLAWQDPPGRQLHQAVKQRILRPDSPHAGPFVRWFRELYRL